MTPDLLSLDLPGFIDFVFDHPAYEGQDVELDGNRLVRIIEQRPTPWYWDVDWYWGDVSSAPLHTLDLVTQLFENADVVLGRFTPRQIAQGFGLLLGTDLLKPTLWDATVPWEPRERLLRAVIPLYERLFDVEVTIEFVPFMLWDSLLVFRYLEPATSGLSADELRIQEAVVSILEALLRSDGPWSVPGALHGAYHVNHARALRAVEQWIATQEDDGRYWRGYAEDVLRGEAQ